MAGLYNFPTSPIPFQEAVLYSQAKLDALLAITIEGWQWYMDDFTAHAAGEGDEKRIELVPPHDFANVERIGWQRSEVSGTFADTPHYSTDLAQAMRLREILLKNQGIPISLYNMVDGEARYAAGVSFSEKPVESIYKSIMVYGEDDCECIVWATLFATKTVALPEISQGATEINVPNLRTFYTR